MKTLFLALTLVMVAQSHAAGGMIGGGDEEAYLCYSNPNIDDIYKIHIEPKNGALGYLVSVESAAGSMSAPLEAEKSLSTGPDGRVLLFTGAGINLRLFADQPPEFPQFHPRSNKAIVDFANFPANRIFQNTQVDCDKL